MGGVGVRVELFGGGVGAVRGVEGVVVEWRGCGDVLVGVDLIQRGVVEMCFRDDFM